MSTYVTTGLVLQIRPHRESSRLYTIFTKDYGKIEAVATGSLKINSKLSPHLLPLSEVEIMVAKGKVWDRLAGAKSVRQLINMSQPHNMILGQGYLEVVAALTGSGQVQINLYELLIKSFQELNNLSADEKVWRNQARHSFFNFTFAALQISGLAPNCLNCEICHQSLTENTLFDWRHHGFVHNKCCLNKSHSTVIDEAVRTWLTKISLGKPLGEQMPMAALAFINKYMAGQIGHELATLKVLKSVI